MSLLAIDPGINGCGVAVFDHAALVHAFYAKSIAPTDADMLTRIRACARAVQGGLSLRGPHAHAVSRLVVEMPQIYTFGKGKGDPNDLLPLAGVLGALSATFWATETRAVTPREWKGGVDGDVFIETRIKPRLTADERSRVSFSSAKGLQHNVYDAVGIGLYAVGRLERKRVYAR